MVTSQGTKALEPVAFRDRREAGERLAAEVERLVSGPCVVAGIPRGGVAVALPVATRLRCPLTVAHARKLPAPLFPEFAFGALDADGEATVEAATVAALALSPVEVEQVRVRVAEEIRRQMALYGAPFLARYLPGRTVVLVDDGLATGLTMRAALAHARRHGAARVIVATPCASAAAARRLRREADGFASLIVEEDFVAVGRYYVDFSPVSDREVRALLARGRRAMIPPGAERAGIALSFTNPAGCRLAGELLVPPAPGPHPVAALAHGRASGKDGPREQAVAGALLADGIAAFLFDFTGHGDSEGALPDSTLARRVDDLGAALDALEALDEVDAGRMAVVGEGSGAAVALERAAMDPRILVLALCSPDPTGAEEAIARVTAPALLVVGQEDRPALAASERLLGRLAGPRVLEVVPGADQRFETPEARREAARLVADWLKKHLG